MTLPGKVDAENVTATLKKGLLEIRLPRTGEPEAKHIEIKVK
jgi:HSP20 family molecular chaperone IbpA